MSCRKVSIVRSTLPEQFRGTDPTIEEIETLPELRLPAIATEVRNKRSVEPGSCKPHLERMQAEEQIRFVARARRHRRQDANRHGDRTCREILHAKENRCCRAPLPNRRTARVPVAGAAAVRRRVGISSGSHGRSRRSLRTSIRSPKCCSHFCRNRQAQVEPPAAALARQRLDRLLKTAVRSMVGGPAQPCRT